MGSGWEERETKTKGGGSREMLCLFSYKLLLFHCALCVCPVWRALCTRERERRGVWGGKRVCVREKWMGEENLASRRVCRPTTHRCSRGTDAQDRLPRGFLGAAAGSGSRCLTGLDVGGCGEAHRFSRPAFPLQGPTDALLDLRPIFVQERASPTLASQMLTDCLAPTAADASAEVATLLAAEQEAGPLPAAPACCAGCWEGRAYVFNVRGVLVREERENNACACTASHGWRRAFRPRRAPFLAVGD